MSLRALLEHGLNARWYGNTPPGPSARLLAYIYGRLRPKTRAQKPNRSLPVRVVVVGNLTVGGVGKTPLVIAIVRLATELGLRVGVIARGYGGHARGVVQVRADSDWREVGDEPLLIKRLTQAPMVIGRLTLTDRVAFVYDELKYKFEGNRVNAVFNPLFPINGCPAAPRLASVVN